MTALVVYYITITNKIEIMNCRLMKFMKLSVRQIKTYAAVIMMSALAFEASATETVSGEIMNPGMESGLMEVEISLESWMASPFEVGIDEGSAEARLLTPASELAFEAELALESWMGMPFEVIVPETSPMEISICAPAP